MRNYIYIITYNHLAPPPLRTYIPNSKGRLHTLSYLINVQYGINVMGGSFQKINKRHVWNKRNGMNFLEKQ